MRPAVAGGAMTASVVNLSTVPTRWSLRECGGLVSPNGLLNFPTERPEVSLTSSPPVRLVHRHRLFPRFTKSGDIAVCAL